MATLTVDATTNTATIGALTTAQVRAVQYVIQKRGITAVLDGFEQHVRNLVASEREKDTQEIKMYLDTRLTDTKRDAILAIIRQP